jgi:hypothetical protein
MGRSSVARPGRELLDAAAKVRRRREMAKANNELATEIVVAWLGAGTVAGSLRSDAAGQDYSQMGKKIGEVYTEVLKAVKAGGHKEAA